MRNFLFMLLLPAVSALCLASAFMDRAPLWVGFLGGVPIAFLSLRLWFDRGSFSGPLARMLLASLIFGLLSAFTALGFFTLVWPLPLAMTVAAIPGLTLSARLFTAMTVSRAPRSAWLRPPAWVLGWTLADLFFLYVFPVMPFGVMGYLPARTDFLMPVGRWGVWALSLWMALFWILLAQLVNLFLNMSGGSAGEKNPDRGMISRAGGYSSFVLALLLVLMPLLAKGGAAGSAKICAAEKAATGSAGKVIILNHWAQYLDQQKRPVGEGENNDVPSRAPAVSEHWADNSCLAGLAAIQPCIEQALKNSVGNRHSLLDLELDISREAVLFLRRQTGSDELPVILLWPETSTPDLLRLDTLALEKISDFCFRNKANIILGTRDSGQDQSSGERIFFNSAVHFDSLGNWAGTYDKVLPTTFAETGPYTGVFSVFNSLRVIDHRVVSGSGSIIFKISLGERVLSAGPMICYESIFPARAGDLAHRGAELLLCLSNDAWFAGTSMPFHMVDETRIRALETGLPLLRSANTGVSFLADSGGRELERLEFGRRGFLASVIGLIPDREELGNE